MRLLGGLIFLLLINSAFGINKDSLKLLCFNVSLPDSVRLSAFDDLAWEGYLFSHPDSAYYFANKELELAQKTNNLKFQKSAYNTMGASFYIHGKFLIAADYYEKALDIDMKIGDKKGISHTINNIGLLFQKQGNYPKAISYFTRSLALAEEMKDDKAIGYSLNNIGIVYERQADYKKAKYYLEKSYQNTLKRGDKEAESSNLTNLGNICHSLNEFSEAIRYFHKSIAILREIDTKGVSIAQSYLNLGLSYKAIKRMDSAEYYLKESYRLRKDVEDAYGECASLYRLGRFYFENDEKQKAEQLLSDGLSLAKEIGALDLLSEISEFMVNVYVGRDNYRLAYETYLLHISTRDSLFNEQNTKKILEQEYAYEYNKKMVEDSVKSAEREKVIVAENALIKTRAEKQNLQLMFVAVCLILLAIFVVFVIRRLRITDRQKKVIQHQKAIVDEKQKEIIDSINYAKRLQEAILPTRAAIQNRFKQSFILYLPKAIVAGDFYWFESVGQMSYLAAADCTGHGVPGALVSVICSAALTKSVQEDGKRDPGKILDRTRELVIEQFSRSTEEVRDGMDISLCAFNHDTNVISWAGANNPLWIVKNNSNEVIELKPDKQPIGTFDYLTPFTCQEIQLNRGDTFYMFSDGYADQFGGERGKKMKAKRFKEIVATICAGDMVDQENFLAVHFENWRGTFEQIDDVCVIGVRVL